MASPRFQRRRASARAVTAVAIAAITVSACDRSAESSDSPETTLDDSWAEFGDALAAGPAPSVPVPSTVPEPPSTTVAPAPPSAPTVPTPTPAAPAAPAPSAPPTAPAGAVPIMGAPALTGTEIAAWFEENRPRSGDFTEYRAMIPVAELAELFIRIGEAEGVRGDIAFAQAIQETGWFNFPDHGQVRPFHNNYAGIGACNSCDGGFEFPSPEEGVRAQLQRLRCYADPESGYDMCPTVIGNGTKVRGAVPTWQQLNGIWAVPGDGYGEKILSLHQRMVDFASARRAQVATPMSSRVSRRTLDSYNDSRAI